MHNSETGLLKSGDPPGDPITTPFLVTTLVVHVVAISILVYVWFFTLPEIHDAFDELDAEIPYFSKVVLFWNSSTLRMRLIMIPAVVIFDGTLVFSLMSLKAKLAIITWNVLVVLIAIALVVYTISCFGQINRIIEQLQ